MENLNELKATGLQVQYYFVCKRKLWLYSHQIQFEQDSDKVLQGKVLHEQSYNRTQTKEVVIDNLIKIDLFEDYVGEVKSSSKMQEADRMQLLYYLFVLKNAGIKKVGKLHYPKEKRIEEVYLTDYEEKKIHQLLIDIEKINKEDTPPRLKKLPYCTKCAYFSFCWVGEEE